jgi:hypothetical protein
MPTEIFMEHKCRRGIMVLEELKDIEDHQTALTVQVIEALASGGYSTNSMVIYRKKATDRLHSWSV